MTNLKVYAAVLPNAYPGSLHYYGDADGLEVDAIIELRDGRWAALEIKLGESKVPDGIKNIKRLRHKVALNPTARNPQPEFSAVVTATSPFAATMRKTMPTCSRSRRCGHTWHRP